MFKFFFYRLKKVLIIILFSSLIGATSYYILFKHIVSEGKAQGVLFKITKRKKLFFIPIWEGTLNISGGKTFSFAIKDDSIAEEIYKYEGKQIVVFYENPVLSFPSAYNDIVYDWKAIQDSSQEVSSIISLCFLLSSLEKNITLFQQVKEYLEKDNIYFKNILDSCKY